MDLQHMPTSRRAFLKLLVGTGGMLVLAA